jgi:uncharacterized membrane protein
MSARTDASTDVEKNIDPVIHPVRAADLPEILKLGAADFEAKPTHGVFITLIYGLIALFTALVGLGENFLPLLFPLLAGTAILGPLAASGLYELSRRREQGLDYSWHHVFDVIHAPSRWGIAAMGAVLAILFAAWLMTAQLLYDAFFTGAHPDTLTAMWQQVFSTSAGWRLLIVGSAIGFVYSIVVYAATVVSLPMMLHHKIPLGKAVLTSLRAVQHNWRAMAAWYCIVVAMVLLGSLPLFLGLAVVVPILGHATWHLYRRTVSA